MGAGGWWRESKDEWHTSLTWRTHLYFFISAQRAVIGLNFTGTGFVRQLRICEYRGAMETPNN